MEDQFKTEAMPDTRGEFERQLIEWFDESMRERIEHNQRVEDQRPLLELQKISGINDAQRILISQAMTSAARNVAETIGRCIDEVTAADGLRYYAIPFIISSVHGDLGALRNVLDRVLTEQLVFGEARPTPNCDCHVCAFVTLMNKTQAHVPAHIRRGE